MDVIKNIMGDSECYVLWFHVFMMLPSGFHCMALDG